MQNPDNHPANDPSCPDKSLSNNPRNWDIPDKNSHKYDSEMPAHKCPDAF